MLNHVSHYTVYNSCSDQYLFNVWQVGMPVMLCGHEDYMYIRADATDHDLSFPTKSTPTESDLSVPTESFPAEDDQSPPTEFKGT